MHYRYAVQTKLKMAVGALCWDNSVFWEGGGTGCSPGSQDAQLHPGEEEEEDEEEEIRLG